MEDYYAILGCERTETPEKLKAAYFSLVKKHHPDKCMDLLEETNDEFKKIDKAWKTLRDPNLKQSYDEDLKQYELNDKILLHDSVTLKELSYDSQKQIYCYPCRCGGQYYFPKNELDQFDTYFLSCDTCSLIISVDVKS